jgi:hypothetical protein
MLEGEISEEKSSIFDPCLPAIKGCHSEISQSIQRINDDLRVTEEKQIICVATSQEE